MAVIYKICPADTWREAEAEGRFRGAGIDLADGFIHFSTADQVVDVARRFFAGVDGLLLIAVDADRLGPDLRYELSSDGEAFPHLYAPLDLDAVLWARPMPLRPDGSHDLPAF